MNTLLSQLSKTVGAAFGAYGLPAEFGAVKISDRPDLAQFQCNGAMAAAKKMGKNPREVAAQIIAELQKSNVFARAEAVGPGFINLDIHDDVLTTHINALSQDADFAIPQPGAGQTVVLDYGGPQIAKHMHVGHLRTGIVGDTLRRLLLSVGYRTIGDVHLGDWGLQMGMVISELEVRFPDLPYFNPDFKGDYPSEPPVPFDDMGELYPTAAAACREDAARMERARRATLDLQQKRLGYMALWQNLLNVSIEAMRKNYASLNVHFDLWRGEYDADYLIPDMIADYKKTNHAILSDGAWIIPVARNDDKKEFPPLLLVKSDGAYLYSTTDLATIIDREKTYHPDWCIYVVDQRQGLHFEQVFRAARLGRLVPDNTRLDFAGIGTMNGADGKPFKTRAGGVLKLEDLIAQGVEKAKARMAEVGMANNLPVTEQADIARIIAVAAIKFADLKNARHVDYVFDLDAMTSFEGKTGPYLLYQTVRITSLLAKAKVQNLKPADHLVIDDEMRSLALLIADFPNAVALSVDALSAHVLCDYLHRLAQEFSSFYAQHHILTEATAQKQTQWLGISQLCARTLTRGLELLGIDIPARM